MGLLGDLVLYPIQFCPLSTLLIANVCSISGIIKSFNKEITLNSQSVPRLSRFGDERTVTVVQIRHLLEEHCILPQ